MQSSANVMDLRFVPDDVEFTNAPRDSAKSVPEDYEPPTFSNTALQYTRVHLTWDEPDPVRCLVPCAPFLRALRWFPSMFLFHFLLGHVAEWLSCACACGRLLPARLCA